MTALSAADGYFHLAQLAPYLNSAQQARLARRLRACHARRFAGVLAKAVERVCALPCGGESAAVEGVAQLHYTNGDRHWWITERAAGAGSSNPLRGARGFAARSGAALAPVLVDLDQVIERGAELDLTFEPLTRQQIVMALRLPA